MFSDCLGTIAAWTADAVCPALERVADAVREGRWAAGGLAYEAGLAFEPRLRPLLERRPPAGPLLWFGLFGPPAQLTPARLDALFDGAGPARAGPARPRPEAAAHAEAVARAQALIAAGDIYQVNLTFGAEVPVAGHPLALFARLWREGRPPCAALVFTGAQWWISLSPELFFRCEAGRLTARPMKGTAARGQDPASDRAAVERLRTDPKNRAENLMIVDLIRNDLARVAEPGSVAVEALFAVEPYASIHQMTSTVTARLAGGRDAADVLGALFPCGSVTGAPRIRAMEVIAALEPEARGLYCGSIGWMAPGGRDAAFNVAIRTLVLGPGAGPARLGLGSGIVADSVAADEWQECLAKARFLAPARPASLLETMRREADGGVAFLGRHLDRLCASAARFGFPADRAKIEAAIAALPPPGAPARLRLKLSHSGALALQQGPMPPPWPDPVPAALVRLPCDPADWRLAHKTSAREPYEAALAAARARGAAEALLVRADGLVTEGAATSLFVDADGTLITPPLALGLLPGVLRAELCASGRAREHELSAEDVQAASHEGRLFVGNVLRGLVPARLVQA